MIGTSAPKTQTFKFWREANEPSTARLPAARLPASLHQSGFTLIEIMIVIALMALVMSFAIPQFGAAIKLNLSNASRQMANLIRATHDEAVLKGSVHRLAIDLDKRQYWVEVGERQFVMLTQEQEEEQRRINERRSEDERAKHKDKFVLAQSITKKKTTLPTGVSFTDVINARSKEPVKGGMVYAHFFPHGFVEKLVIHLKDNYNRENTLIVNSVTGKSRLYELYQKDVE